MLYWRHRVTPKPGAVVAVTAGGEPVLITGTYGQGRVAVFAGTALGEPNGQEVPFWQWSDWPRLLQNTITWVAQ